MKIIETLSIISLSLIFYNCKDDNQDNFNFTPEFLNQTQWKGVLTESFVLEDQPYEWIYNVGFFFETTNRCRYSLKLESAERASKDVFGYSVQGKILEVNKSGSGRTLDGSWILIQHDQNRLILEKGTGGDGAHKGRLTLTRVH